MDPQYISPPFALEEFCYSETAHRLGIDNTLDGRKNPQHLVIIKNLSRLARHILLPVFAHFGVKPQISSGYRCPQLNQSVGGVPTSQHQTGQAADFSLPDIAATNVALWIRDRLSFDQLLIERASGKEWVHVSFVALSKNRRDVKWFDGTRWHAGLPLGEPTSHGQSPLTV